MRNCGSAVLEFLFALSLAVLMAASCLSLFKSVFALKGALRKEAVRWREVEVLSLMAAPACNRWQVRAEGERLLVWMPLGAGVCRKGKLIRRVAGEKGEWYRLKERIFSSDRPCEEDGIGLFLRPQLYLIRSGELKVRMGKGPFQPLLEGVDTFKSELSEQHLLIQLGKTKLQRRLE